MLLSPPIDCDGSLEVRQVDVKPAIRRECPPRPLEKHQPGLGESSAVSPDARLAAKCRAGILDVDRMGRERHDARPAGETPSAFLVEDARSMIFGERPEARLLDIRFAKPNQSEVVKRASDTSAPELWQHIQGLQDAAAHRNHSDGLVVLARNVRLPIWVGECGNPVRANRVLRELIEARWEDVLEARDRRSARSQNTARRPPPSRARLARPKKVLQSKKQHKVSPARASSRLTAATGATLAYAVHSKSEIVLFCSTFARTARRFLNCAHWFDSGRGTYRKALAWRLRQITWLDVTVHANPLTLSGYAPTAGKVSRRRACVSRTGSDGAPRGPRSFCEVRDETRQGGSRRDCGRRR
jgi:hypothetical protein